MHHGKDPLAGQHSHAVPGTAAIGDVDDGANDLTILVWELLLGSVFASAVVRRRPGRTGTGASTPDE